MENSNSIPMRPWHHILLGSALCLFHMLYYVGWSFDDPYITFRFVEHVAGGHGFVFNIGEGPVEGFSNPLWLLMLLPWQWALGADPLMTAATLMGMTCTLLTGPLLAKIWQRTGRPSKDAAPLWRWLPLYVWAMCGPVALWAVGGLETPLVALLMTLLLGAIGANWHRGRVRAALVAGLFGLLMLSRPEGAMYGVAFYGLMGARRVLVAETRWRPWLVGAGVFVAFGLLVEIWRVVTFGDLLPNTYYAKMGTPLIWRLRGGSEYLLAALLMTGGLPIVSLLGLRAWKRSPAIRLAVLCALLQPLFILWVGGDWMGNGRFLVPVLPCLILLATAGVRIAWDDFVSLTERRWLRDLLILAVLIWMVLNVLGEHAATREVVRLLRAERPASPTLMAGYSELLGPLHEVANWITLNTEDGESLAGEEAGLVPFVTQRPFLDLTALNDRHLARQPGGMHGKMDIDYVVNEWRPDWVLLITNPDNASGEVIFPWEGSAGHTLGTSEEFNALYEQRYQVPREFGARVVRIYERQDSN